ncbi:unnamed protein product [Ectocarpus sp. 13 AM-2016]
MLRGALMIPARRAAVVGVMTVAWLSPGRAVMMLLLVSRVKRWGCDAQKSLEGTPAYTATSCSSRHRRCLRKSRLLPPGSRTCAIFL